MNREITDITLGNYLLLSENLIHEKNVLGVFEKIVIAVLARNVDVDGNVKPMGIDGIQKSVEKHFFGIKVPLDVINVINKRLVRRGDITLDRNRVVISHDLYRADLRDEQRKSHEQANSFIKDISEYISVNTRETWEVKRIEDATIRFIEVCGLLTDRETTIPQEEMDYEDCRIIALFFEEKKDDDKWDTFVQVAQGFFIEKAMIPDITEKDLNGTRVYLDTNILLSLRGLHGDSKRKATKELLKLIKHYKGKPYVIEDTIAEAQGVLTWRAHKLEYNNPFEEDATTRFLRTHGYKYSDLQRWSKSLRGFLEGQRVLIDDTTDIAALRDLPTNNEDYLRDKLIDRRKKRHSLTDSEENAYEIEPIDPANEDETTARAIDHKINLVKLIYSKRSTNTPIIIEKCKAILATENSFFTRLINRSHKIKGFGGIEPLIRTYSLTTYLWIKNPLFDTEVPEIMLSSLIQQAVSLTNSELKGWRIKIENAKKSGLISSEEANELYVSDMLDASLGREIILGKGEIPEPNEIIRKSGYLTKKDRDVILKPWKRLNYLVAWPVACLSVLSGIGLSFGIVFFISKYLISIEVTTCSVIIQLLISMLPGLGLWRRVKSFHKWIRLKITGAKP